MIDESIGFTLVRLFDATPERIWRAWTDADEAARWWHPHGMSTPRSSVSIDARVGGDYTYTMVDDHSGEEIVTGGVYLEVVPTTRLVFTWGTPGDEDAPVVTITIEDLGELSRMTFDLRGAEGSSGDNFMYDGWASALDNFAAALAGR